MYLYLSTASCLHLYYIYFSTIIKVYIYIYSIQWCIHKTQSVPTFHINPDSCTEACLSILFGLGSWEVDDWRFPASKGGRSLLVFRVPMKMCWHLGEKKKQIPSKILHNLEILCTFVSRIVRQKDLAFSSSAGRILRPTWSASKLRMAFGCVLEPRDQGFSSKHPFTQIQKKTKCRQGNVQRLQEKNPAAGLLLPINL